MASLKKPAPAANPEIAPVDADAQAVDLAALEAETADATEVEIKPADLRQGELLDMLSDKTGMRKSDLKPVLAALGAEVGQALEEGRTVKWKELGVLKPTKTKETPGGPVVICRLKVADAQPEVAEAAE